MFFLVLITGMLLTLFSTFNVSAAYTPAAGVNVNVSGATTDSYSNGVVTVTAVGKAGWLGSLGASAKTATITITNTKTDTATVSFSWEALNVNSLKIDGVAYSGSTGTFSKELAANANFKVVVTTAKNDTENKLVLSGFSCAVSGKVSELSVNYDESLGSVTVDEQSVSNNGTANIVSDGAVLVATPKNSAIRFLGWVNVETNQRLSSSSTYNLKTEDSIAVRAVFVNASSNAWFLVNGATLYDDLKKATDAAGDGGVVVLMNDATLPSGTHTIPTGVTLLIPFDDGNTLYTDNLGTSSSGTTPSVYRKLTIPDNTTLTINGIMSVGATQYTPGSGDTGGVTGAYGQVVLDGEKAMIQVNDKGKLYAYGYITGSGIVHAQSGAYVYEMMQLRDWRGGSATYDWYNWGNAETKSFVINEYYIQNIESRYRVDHGASSHVCAAMSMSVVGVQKASAIFIGTGGMFQLGANSFVIREYRAEEDRIYYDLYGSMTTAGIALKVSTYDLNTGNFIMPLHHSMTITVKGTDLEGEELKSYATINKAFKLLPGAEIIVEENATLEIASDTELYLYDVADWKCSKEDPATSFVYVQSGIGTHTIKSVRYTPSKPGGINKGTRTELSSPLLKVDGKLIAYNNIYVTTSSSPDKVLQGTGIFENNAYVNHTRKNLDEMIQNGTNYSYPGVDTMALTGLLAGISTDATDVNDSFGTGTYNGLAVNREVDGETVTDYYWYQSETLVPPTCTVAEYWAYTCVNATGDPIKVYTGNPAQHTPGDEQETDPIAATCTTDGSYVGVRYCTVCGEIFSSRDVVVPATGHTQNPKKYQQPVTCTEDGVETYWYCSDCKCYFSDEAMTSKIDDLDAWKMGDGKIEATGHTKTPEKIDEDPATCTEDGVKAYWYCSDCQSYFSNEAMTAKIDNIETWKTGDGKIEANGHTQTPEKTDEDPATCTEDGVRAYWYCSDCECYFSNEAMTAKIENLETWKAGDGKLNKTNHAGKQKTNEQPATCTVDGVKEYWYCSACDSYFSDEGMTSKINDIETWKTGDGKIAQKGHSFTTKASSSVKTAGTCNSVTVYWAQCDRCDVISDTETVNGTIVSDNHNWSEEWSSDETQHWHVCLNGCQQTNGASNHTFVWDHDETQHWKECACGYEQANTRGSHEWNDGECECNYGCAHGGIVNHQPANAPSCTEDGNVEYWQCDTCKKYFADEQCTVKLDQIIDAKTNHPSKQGVAKAPATCTTDGLEAYWYCSDCECYFSDESMASTSKIDDFETWKTGNGKIAATGHTETPAKTDEIPATCTEVGVKAYWYCSDCESYFSDEAMTSKINDLDTWKVGDGKIEATGHTDDPEKTDEDSATCTEDGVRAYWYCSDCESYFSDETMTAKIDNIEAWKTGDGKIEATGHTDEPEKTDEDPATCTEDGVKAYWYCSNCQSYFSNEAMTSKIENLETWKTGEGKIEATGHTDDPEKTDEDPATCTEDGVRAYWYCSDCQSYFSNEAMTSKIDDLGTWKTGAGRIAAHGHNMTGHEENRPTCTEAGNSAYWYCGICEKYFSDAQGGTEIEENSWIIVKNGHTPGATVIENYVAANCTTAGSCDEVVYCTVTSCKAELNRKSTGIEKLGHDPATAVRENVNDSTCHAEGSYEEVVYCTREGCPCSLNGGSQISRVTKTIEKKAHTRGEETRENVVDATCTAPGSYTSIYICTVEACKAEISCTDNVVIPVKGHSFTTYTSDGNATCTVDGTKTAKCDRCNETDTIADVGSATDHNYEYVITPPTCEDDGYYTYTCTAGDHTFTLPDIENPATGHLDNNGDNVCDIDTCKKIICNHTWTVKFEWSEDFLTCTATGTASCNKADHNKSAVATLENLLLRRDEIQPATCTTDGVACHTAVFAESWVGIAEGESYVEVKKEDVVIPATKHDLTQVEAKSATCTEAGYEAYEYCTKCDYTTYAEIPALTHDYASVVTDPTCSTKGYTTHTCKREGCGHSYVDTYLDATGEHVYSEQRYYDRKESWKECTGCKEKYDVVARKYKVTIVDIWDNVTVREDYTYGQYLWLNYSTSNVLDLEYLGWSFEKGGEPIPAYEVWTKAPIDNTTTEFTVYEVSNVKGVKYGAIMMSVDYDKADSNKTMTVDLFIYVDSLADKHKPTVKLGEDELTLEMIDESIMMWFVSIPLSAEQITQGGDNVKITVNYKDVPVKTINSVLIAYEQALDTYLKENVGDYAGGLQDEAINAMLNYGKTVQVYFENQKPSDWAFKGYTDIANYSNSTAPTQKSNADETFTWKSANVRFDEEYSMRYDIELILPEGATIENATATLIVRDANGQMLDDPYINLAVEPKVEELEDGTERIVPNRYYVIYPVPASDLAKAGTTVQMTVTLSDGTTIESPEYEYGIHAHLTYSVYLYMEYENEDGTTYHNNYVTGDDHTTGAKTKQYVDMIVSLLKLGEAVNKVEEMTSNQQ